MMKFTGLLIVLMALFGVDRGSAQIPPVTSYMSDVKSEFQKIWPNNRRINLVFHGHSGPGGSWNDSRVNTLNSYPHLVLEKLKAVYPYAVINVIVTAVGGENSEKGAARFEQEVLNHHPDVVVIDYTGNDVGLGIEKSRAAWEQMINLAKESGAKVMLVTPGVDQRIDINSAGNSYAKHAELIRDLAGNHRVALADPFAVFQKLVNTPGFVQDYMSWINHFNRKGHEVYADEVAKWFVNK